MKKSALVVAMLTLPLATMAGGYYHRHGPVHTTVHTNSVAFTGGSATAGVVTRPGCGYCGYYGSGGTAVADHSGGTSMTVTRHGLELRSGGNAYAGVDTYGNAMGAGSATTFDGVAAVQHRH